MVDRLIWTTERILAFKFKNGNRFSLFHLVLECYLNLGSVFAARVGFVKKKHFTWKFSVILITFGHTCERLHRGSSVSQVLQTLGTETYRPSSASQCVAGIACAEIPVNQWPELIPQLVANVTDPSSTEHMKESTLEAIGYICQDIVSFYWRTQVWFQLPEIFAILSCELQYGERKHK